MVKKAGPPILKSLGDGNFVRVACRVAGISQRTFYRWRERADEEREAGRKTVHTRLFDEIELAEARAEAALVREVRKRNPLEILKRRWPERWGDQRKIKLCGEENGPPITTTPPVIVNLTFEDPDDEDLWIDATGDE